MKGKPLLLLPILCIPLFSAIVSAAVTACITDTGKHCHTSACRYLKKSKFALPSKPRRPADINLAGFATRRNELSHLKNRFATQMAAKSQATEALEI